MRYLVLLSPTSVPSTPPPPDLMEAIMQLGADATTAGALLDTAGLQPAGAALVRLAAGDVHVTDGPFTETKEIISYAVYDVASREEAIEWTSRFLRLHRDLWAGWEGEAQVLPFFTMPSGQVDAAGPQHR
ncbi:YciI family protein [Cellulomonas sp. NS3]|uniref:YciI family protein n=1 Tax=Cellulomonas sp. NS3 TaxID=2973977 RepID=UPI002161B987|nr:YciI family protein [Cellulomonas sp. NS3]